MYKIKSIKALDNYIIHVDFENGVSKEYDVKTLISDFKDFESLTQVHSLFEQVKVDVGGYGVSWNDELDLSCNELYANGVSISANVCVFSFILLGCWGIGVLACNAHFVNVLR